MTWGAPASGQLFSPGKLAAPHAAWDGLDQCDVCHSGREQVDPARCLKCHEPLGRRVREARGYHGLSAERRRDCQRCHTDHQGAGRRLIDWPGGARERFPHRETGWALEGAHAKLACDKCHDKLHVTAPEVRAWVARYPGYPVYLGLSRACVQCHHDEHRGSLGTDCGRCHDLERFRPAPRFDHARAWALEGAHAKVACGECHPTTTDPAYKAGAFPHPRAASFSKMKPIPHGRCVDCHEDPHQGKLGTACRDCHGLETFRVSGGLPAGVKLDFHDRTAFPLRAKHRTVRCEQCHPRSAQGELRLRPITHGSCSDCHRDPHQGRFGRDCRGCHDETGWATRKISDQTLAFHDKTAYPLRGQHRSVQCDRCHPRDASGARRLRPVPHAACLDCHVSAHPELAGSPAAAQACERCHTVEGFTPSLYGLAEHQRSPYPLVGGHRAVACPECHRAQLGPPEAVTSGAGSPGSVAPRPSSWRLRLAPGRTVTSCSACHATPHREQFGDRPCEQCHDPSRWTLTAGRFDHDRQARFPLVGAHRTAPCAACHRSEQDARGQFVRYRPLAGECTACHADPHLGQFRLAPPVRSCADCHTTTAFAPSSFDHQDPQDSDWPRRGAHLRVACDQCHRLLPFADGRRTVRYRSTPRSCDLCHADPHRGAYARFATLAVATGAARPALQLPARTDCAACHGEGGWSGAQFDHARTGFALRGLHAGLPCNDCHVGGDFTAPLAPDCAACHEDVHGRRLGRDCLSCHDEDGFVDARRAARHHDRTAFPLLGRHAAVPCSECHLDVRDLGFDEAPATCAACHRAERPLGGSGKLDHRQPGFDEGCERCHATVAWDHAYFAAHDRCFPVASGAHRGIGCAECHTPGVPAAVVRCNSGTASCIGCHGCGGHRGVLGFECKNAKCYRCHPGGGE